MSESKQSGQKLAETHHRGHDRSSDESTSSGEVQDQAYLYKSKSLAAVLADATSTTNSFNCQEDVKRKLIIETPNHRSYTGPFLTPIASLTPLKLDSSKQNVRSHLAGVRKVLEDDDLTPNIRRHVERFESLLEKMLQGIASEELHDHLQYAEESVRHHEEYRLSVSTEVKKLQSAIVFWKKLELAARCGDYMADLLTSVKGVKEKKRYWTETVVALLAEHNDARYGDPTRFYEALGEKPTHKLLYKACRGLGIAKSDVNAMVKWYSVWIIKYADRNDRMHTGFDNLARDRDWKGLGDQVTRDLELLPHFFLPSEEDQLKMYEALLVYIRNKWVYRVGNSWLPRRPVYEAMAKGIDDFQILKEASNLSDTPSEESIERLKRKYEEKAKHARRKFTKEELYEKQKAGNAALNERRRDPVRDQIRARLREVTAEKAALAATNQDLREQVQRLGVELQKAKVETKS